MAPIRVALIGLSESAKTSWAASAHLPYLLSDRGRARYRIVALLNSSEEAAQKAINYYKLDPDAKAYGSPEDLAADSTVDLVACSTRVDIHYDAVKPSIQAGKAVFVEWPLAENVRRASELAEMAKKSGSTTLVGLQARVAPSALKVKELIEAGTIGKVVSSEMRGSSSGGGGASISEGLAYFLDKKVEGNPITILLGHSIDFIHAILGEYEASHSHLQIQRPDQSIRGTDGSTTSIRSDVPDLASIHGTLKEGKNIAKGASLLITFSTGPPFPGATPFVWTITGEEGRIQMSSERGPVIQSESSGFPIPIKVEDFATGEVQEVSWSWDDWQRPLMDRGKNLAKVYDLYAESLADGLGVADFEAAVVRHRQLDEMLY